MTLVKMLGIVARLCLPMGVAMGSTIAGAAAMEQSAPVTASADDAQVAALVKTIAATIDAIPAQARASDIEARLAFAVDQAQARCSIAQRAVQQAMLNGPTRPGVRAALRNIGVSVARCDKSGTAALPAAKQVLAQGTTLSLGGGSSNYVTP